MDKPCQNNLYSGLLIYRLQRNVEYLLLNDSFTNKKHWFCPKGQVIGQEDEVKCALRETFETTGLRPKDLRVEEGFKIELKYLSGTRPKKVVYRLAQILDNHARLLPSAEGVHLQWCNQAVATEKVIFKSMQDVFKYAQSFIESRQKQKQNRRQQHDKETAGRPVNGRPSLSPSVTSSPARRQLTEATHNNNNNSNNHNSNSNSNHNYNHNHNHNHSHNPLYKTRLCERFETEGSCPYGLKCTFAHGIAELRERVEEDQRHKGSPEAESNPLYKTKLCERYMRDKFCQYGPKCHFAHGEAELKERPNHETSRGHRMLKQENGDDGGGNAWRPRTDTRSVGETKVNDTRAHVDDATDELSKLSIQQAGDKRNVQNTMNGNISQTSKSWMKIVHLSKEEQARMDITPPTKTPSPTPGKSAIEENIIGELRAFFIKNPSPMRMDGKLSDDVKEVTKLEMRNDLSKRQLLYILLVSLLEKGTPSVKQVLELRAPLFKTFVKTPADQHTLLKAWERFVTQRCPALLSKTVVAFTTWYDCDLVEDEVFIAWHEALSADSELKERTTRFVEWLSTDDDEKE